MAEEIHLVVGAAGSTGRRVASRLAAAGRTVWAVTRDGRDVGVPDVRTVAADAMDPAAIRPLAARAAVLYHCAMPPMLQWWSLFPALTDALLEACSAGGCRLVFADDTWMYGRVTAPMSDRTPVRPVSRKGVLRAFMAERILRAAAAGDVRASIVRAGELYGPGVRSLIAGNLFAAVAAGRPALWFGDPDQPITPTFIDDFAHTLAAVGTQDTTNGSVWHVPHPPATTGRSLHAEASRQTGGQTPLLRARPGLVRALGTVVPLIREGAELLYQFEQPFVVDGATTAREFGIEPTPWGEGVAACLAAAAARTTTAARGRAQPVPALHLAKAGSRSDRRLVAPESTS